ncbi:MAG: hypothetical protein HRT80_01000 [Henriciella sp.]|nr:hypothetical protein [Henriciella sp.]
MSDFRVISFWATLSNKTHIPPYILCGLVSIKRAFQDRFLLLTPNTLEDHIDFDFQKRVFFFAASADKEKDELSRIVGTSDFVRFAYIAQHGGMWLDADSIVLRNFEKELQSMFSAKPIAWQCEALFAAQGPHPDIDQIKRNMIEAPRQLFGNPGECKTYLNGRNDDVSLMPSSLWDPTGNQSYSAKTWERSIASGNDLDTFLENPECAVIKLYNSSISQNDLSDLSVREFLERDTILGKLFLHIEPSIEFWVEKGEELHQGLVGEHMWPATHPYV